MPRHATHTPSLTRVLPPFGTPAAIALELRRLDAEQAAEHLTLVRGFLPEVFFEQEHEAIRAMLALRRSVSRFVLGPGPRTLTCRSESPCVLQDRVQG